MASQASARVPEPPVDQVVKESRTEDEAIESLRKEIERLRTRLEEERKKLNDVTCESDLPSSLLDCRASRSWDRVLTSSANCPQSQLLPLAWTTWGPLTSSNGDC